MNRRPSDREIINRARDALKALEEGKFVFATNKHLYADRAELGFEAAADFVPMLIAFLGEILAEGPERCYAGRRPPIRSYEAQIKNLEMWAYAWDSERMGQRMYLKFVLKGDHFYYVDCHRDAPEKRK